MAPRDRFPYAGSLDSAADGFAVSPSDSNDLNDLPRALWVGGAGDVALALPSGNVVLKGVQAGTLISIRPIRVRATGTTATDIVALL
jgi:hypothetical protein